MTTNQLITVRHNVEMSHRLFLTPGKCQRIHGHSFDVNLTLGAEVDETGKVAGLDFGTIKAIFRRYLDSTYDHSILLNRADPWAGDVNLRDTEGWSRLPGLQVFDTDPTTENFARAIGEWVLEGLSPGDFESVKVVVWETAVNQAEWRWRQ